MSKLPNTTEAVLLACLLNGERYGRELREEYGKRTGRPLPFGSLYVVLERMERAGLVGSRMSGYSRERGGNRRRYFRLRAEGRRALDALSTAIMSGALLSAGVSR